MKSIVVLISGNGSNLQSIMDAIDSGSIDGKIVAVISDQANAYGLERAKKPVLQAMFYLTKGLIREPITTTLCWHY